MVHDARYSTCRHRDTQAIHAKLDEIVHAVGGARNEVAHIDDQEPEEIEAHRDKMREEGDAFHVMNASTLLRLASSLQIPAIKD
jgi:low affinity Fe/Cu permease